MSLITRGGLVILGEFGARSDHIPERAAPVATVDQYYADNEQETYLAVEITGTVAGATSYSVTVIDAVTLATVASATIASGVLTLVGPLPHVTVDTPLLYRIAANPNGIALQGSVSQVPIVPLAEVTPPTLAATTVGDLFIITPPVWTVAPTAGGYTIEEDADGAGTGTPLFPTPTHVPIGGTGKFYRVVFEGYGPAGDGPIFSTSPYIGPIVASSGLTALTPSNIVIGASEYWPSTQATWFKFVFEKVGIPANAIVQATTTDPISFPNDGPSIDWKPTEELRAGEWTMVDVSLASDPTTGRPPNYTVFRVNPDSSDLNKLRFRYALASAPTVWSPISLPSWRIPAPAENPPNPTDLVWRQYLRRSSAQIGVTPDIPHLFSQGIFGADGQQFLMNAAWSANGAKIAMGQDSASVMFSTTAGATWYRPRQIGMTVSTTKAIASDPANSNRWLVALEARGDQPGSADESGIYVTTDDFDHISMVKQITGYRGSQHTTDNFSVYPKTGGASATWYLAININGSNQAASLFKSTNNGATWDAGTAFLTSGRIYSLHASAHAANRLYAGTASGLRRSTNGSTFSAFAGNLPAGSVRFFWEDPLNASHAFCTITSLDSAIYGLYECNNLTAGSQTWTRIRQCRAVHAAVGAISGGQRTIYVKCANNGSNALGDDTDHVRMRGGTWITRATSPGITFNVAGGQSNAQPWEGMTGLNSTMNNPNALHTTSVWAHPTDEDTFVVHCVTANFKTVDQGRNVNVSSSGYGGLVIRDMFYPMETKNHFAGAAHDVAPSVTKDGGLSTRTISQGSTFKSSCVKVLNYAIESFTGRGICRVPDDVTVAAWRGRYIYGAGPSNSKESCMGYTDADMSTAGHWMGAAPTARQSNATGGGPASRATSGYLRHDHDKIWNGPNIIDLGVGTTWGVTAHSILGARHDGSSVLYGFSGNDRDILRCASWGGAWTVIYSFTQNFHSLNAPIGGCSAYDGRRMFIRDPDSRIIRMIFDNDGSVSSTGFNLNGTIAGTVIFPTSSFGISSIVGDALDERYLYITTSAIGTLGRAFRLKFNSGRTGFDECTNITSNMAVSAKGVVAYSQGLSGGVQTCHDGTGSYVFPSPADWQPRVGWFKFSGQPSNNQTLSINGVTWTFKTSGATTAQTNIGASLSATLTQLATDLNASANASITPCTYTARYGTRLEVTMDNPTQGVDAPFPLTAGTTSSAAVYDNVVPCKDYHWLRCPLPIYEL